VGVVVGGGLVVGTKGILHLVDEARHDGSGCVVFG
jgi:hypothetical protein